MPFIIESFKSAGQPSLAEFEAKAKSAFNKLPNHVRNLCEGVLFEVADFPAQDVLKSLDLDSPFDLLGLFEGEGFAQTGGEEWTGKLPNRIWLYRQPILDYAQEQSDSLDAIISHVLIHEIGHHFGLSDDDMEKIDNSQD